MQSSAQESSTVPSEYSQHVSPTTDWKEIVAWVGDLPPLPHVAAQALSLIDDPDVTAQKLSALLGEDAALAARVLKIANSAMFARQRSITTINQAIMVLGFKTLKGIIVAASIRQVARKFGDKEKMVWENSTCTAIAARLVAQKIKRSYAEEAFLFGLLHDLGKLVLLRQLNEAYEATLEAASARGETYVQVEQESLGFAHPLIGALVAKKWNFPMETCMVILHHHDELPVTIKDPQAEKTLVVHLGDLVAHSLGYGHKTGYPDQSEARSQVATLLKISNEDLEAVTVEVKQLFEQMNAVFS